MKDKIINKLQENFNPDLLEVINNSHLHSRHFKAENLEHHNQTHFLIKISSNKFENLKRIEIHRKINEVLKEEFKNGLHALEIKLINL